MASVFLPDETFWDTYLRHFPRKVETGLAVLDACHAEMKGEGLIEVCGEAESGKTTLLLSLATNVLCTSHRPSPAVAEGRPSSSPPIRERAHVIWVDCNGQLAEDRLYVSVASMLAHEVGLQAHAAAPDDARYAVNLLSERVVECLGRFKVVRPRSLEELAFILSQEDWLGAEAAQGGAPSLGSVLARPAGGEGGPGSAKRPRTGAKGGPAGAPVDPEEAEGAGTPALVVLDGLGDMVWCACRASGPEGTASKGRADAVGGALGALAARFKCPVLWSRSILFKTYSLPVEVQEGGAVVGAELGAALSHLTDECVSALSHPLLTPCLPSLLRRFPAPVRALPCLVRYTSSGDSSVEREAGLSLPAHVCSWNPGSYFDALLGLQDTVPGGGYGGGMGGQLRARTWATLVTTPVSGSDVVTALPLGDERPGDVAPVVVYARAFLIRWVSAAKDLAWAREAQRAAPGRLVATQATMGGTQVRTQGGSVVRIVYEAGMASVHARLPAPPPQSASQTAEHTQGQGRTAELHVADEVG